MNRITNRIRYTLSRAGAHLGNANDRWLGRHDCAADASRTWRAIDCLASRLYQYGDPR